jgi:hypothetical protein
MGRRRALWRAWAARLGIGLALAVAASGARPGGTAWAATARTPTSGRHPSAYRTVSVPAAGLTMSVPKAWQSQYQVSEQTITELARSLPRDPTMTSLLEELDGSPAARSLAASFIQDMQFLAYDKAGHEELDVTRIPVAPDTDTISKLQATLRRVRPGDHVIRTTIGGRAAIKTAKPDTEFSVLEGPYIVGVAFGGANTSTINAIVRSVRFTRTTKRPSTATSAPTQPISLVCTELSTINYDLQAASYDTTPGFPSSLTDVRRDFADLVQDSKAITSPPAAIRSDVRSLVSDLKQINTWVRKSATMAELTGSGIPSVFAYPFQDLKVRVKALNSWAAANCRQS